MNPLLVNTRRALLVFVLLGLIAGFVPAQEAGADPAMPEPSTVDAAAEAVDADARRPAAGPVMRVELTGALLPVSGDFLLRALTEASERDARLFLIELDTPGGLVITVREMVTAMLASPVPVAVFVAPSGATAASGGAILLLAGDVAAMTTVAGMGAAHPVNAMGENKPDDIMLTKAENDLAAFVRSLADRRGRNPELAESMVRESRSFSTQEALEAGLIEWVAVDLQDLLSQLDQQTVTRHDGRRVTLDLAGAAVETIEPTLREDVLGVLSQPILAFFLLAVGMLGIYAEITNPGTLLPGIVGVMSLLLFALVAQILPVNWIGVGLIALGLGLLLLEAYVVSYGALSVGGIACLVIGALVMFDAPPELRVPKTLLGFLALGLGGIALFLVRLAVNSQLRPVTTGREAMVGLVGEAVSDLGPAGKVLVRGEYYDARCEAPASKGSRIVVLAVDGRELRVRPAADDSTLSLPERG